MLPSVAPFVSPAQIKKFTYIPLDAPAIDPDTSQTLASSVIVVDELMLDLRDDPTVDIILDVVLSSFDPLNLHVINRPYGDNRSPGLLDIPETLLWSRIRRATFTNSGLGEYLDRVAYLADRSPLLDLVYDLTGSAEDQDSLRYVLLDVGADLNWEGDGSREGPAFGHVQVWLSNEDEVALLKEKLVGCSCSSLDIGVKPSVILSP